MNDYLSVFESACAILLQNKGGYGTRKSQEELCSNCIEEQYVHKEKLLNNYNFIIYESIDLLCDQLYLY